MKNLEKKHYIIIAIWFAANILQALFTGLHSDESYYWMYSQNMAWGYFDHPPMVALIIYLGNLILPGEIGVRLIVILLSTFTFALILNELNEKKDLFFVTLFILSFPLVHTHIAGFLAIPDIPLLFFAVLFLIYYRKFLEKPDWLLSLILALLISCMIYSKYHAFLIVGFTVLSNPKLFKSRYFYGIVFLSLLFLIPHILWQVNNDFPTFRYHLIERAKPFQLKYVLPYILTQLVIAGPLTGWLIFWKLFKFKPAGLFQKALIYNIAGFYLLFFMMSFKNRIEAHWVAAIMPMLMIIAYPIISADKKTKLLFKRLALPIVILMILFRIYIAMDIIPNIGKLKITFYNRKASALEIKKLAKGNKVGFFNNYAATSNYIFYTGDSAVHLSTPDYRFCQYDLWNDEKYANGDKLFTVQSKHLNPPELKRTVTGELKGFVTIDSFQPLTRIMISIDSISESEEQIHFFVSLHNTNTFPIFTKHITEPVLSVMQENLELLSVPLKLSSKKIINPDETAILNLTLQKNRINKKIPLIFYTKSKENYRGEIKRFEF